MYAWNKHKLDPEVVLNEPELTSPGKPWWGVEYWRENIGDFPADKLKVPPKPDPFAKKVEITKEDPKSYTDWKKTNFQAKPWFGDWFKAHDKKNTVHKMINDLSIEMDPPV